VFIAKNAVMDSYEKVKKPKRGVVYPLLLNKKESINNAKE
jgi:hypothetical protein